MLIPLLLSRVIFPANTTTIVKTLIKNPTLGKLLKFAT